MTVRNLSLFDDIQPEEINAVGKSRVAEKKEKQQQEQKKEPKSEPQPTPKPEPQPAPTQEPAAKKKEGKREPKKTEFPDGWKAEKQYYSIGEVADLFQVKTSNIRFWTNEFGMKVRTTRKGDRLYNPDQIKELRVIYNLVKEKGYTIAGAKAWLKADKKAGPAESLDLKHSLLQLRNRLLQIRNQLT